MIKNIIPLLTLSLTAFGQYIPPDGVVSVAGTNAISMVMANTSQWYYVHTKESGSWENLASFRALELPMSVSLNLEPLYATNELRVVDYSAEDVLSYLMPSPVVNSPTGVFPESFSAFDPPVDFTTPTNITPAVAEWTRQGQPDDAIALTGESLTNTFVFYGNGFTNDASSLLIDGQECAIKLPAGLPADEMYLMWPTNEHGYGMPVAINKTDAWWIGPDIVATGETFAVYGQNLGADTQIYINGNWYTNNGTANPYRVEFDAPALAVGTHSVWVHNGKGAEYGWSDVQLDLDMWEGFQFDDDTNTWITVTGNTSLDIKNAIASAGEWDTVYIPAGVYTVSSQIDGSINRVRIKGAGTNLTQLVETSGGCGSSFLKFNASDCIIEGFSMYVDSSALTSETLIDLTTGADNVIIRNMHLSQLANAGLNPSSNNIIDMNDESRITIEDSTLVLGGVLLVKNSRDVIIRNCDFYGVDDVNYMISARFAKHIAVEDCTARNYDYDAGVQWTSAGRFFSCQPNSGAPKYFYFGGNETIDLTVHLNNQHNTGEDFLFENTNTKWYGTPTNVAGKVLYFSEVAPQKYASYGPGYTAMIVEGTGLGQAATVARWDTTADEIELERQFLVQPDETSVIAFGWAAKDIVAYGNKFDGLAEGVFGYASADAGVESYGGSHRIIADSNVFTDQEASCYVATTAEDIESTGTNYVMHNMFFRMQNSYSTNCINVVRNSSFEDNATELQGLAPGVGHIGHVFRNNHSHEIDTAFLYEYDGNNGTDWADVRLSLFDGNTGTSITNDFIFDNKQGGSSTNIPTGYYNQVLIDDYIN